MKYLDYAVTFSEFPDEISLCINITHCPWRCKGCHSPELRKDIGKELSYTELDKIIEKSHGISCVGLMGGDYDTSFINSLAFYIKDKYPELKVGWYSGNSRLSDNIELKWFDYIKLGPYDEEKGGLNNPNTNQRMYEYNKFYSDFTIDKGWRDITYKFWKNGK